ncbi:UBC-like protein [Rozella allomycis CSF55]|uniref:UBC-like protein n=1 Tax=Rozella allomycis (strain CSF55) TaxID=988480 RepID=A0A075AWQ5_ROZAC|nr:Ubiquitin-conjugating enzyme, E2 domain-containing protein [Rozella allomycis CSF55]RKP21006.1 UBC-like protein [Rozella allomycis CSF55]|eukprot:EPZ32994.1 Ubiquitin-conjugating enzyme, E2 domain-containing protein [Rozella allomycis CSF55]
MSIPEKATKRLQNELKMMINESPDFVTARPLENNILEWHYVIKGPKDTPYEGGEYHGTVIFPKEYPFKPPSIRMITPNGRFQPNARICLTISDYHPESWNPGWNILTILIGLVSFMVENNYAAGCVNSNESQKKRLLRNLDHSIEATRPLNVTGSLQLKLVLLQDLVDSKLTVDVSSDESSSSTKAKDKKRKMENDCEVIIVQDEKKKKEEKEEDIIVIDD